MRVFSRPLMALAMVLAGSPALLMVATPALAAKEKKPEPPKQQISKEFQGPAIAAQKLLEEMKFAEAQAALPAVKAVAVSPDEVYLYGNLMLRLGIGLKDVPVQKEGLMAVLASGKATPAEIGSYNAYLGEWALGDANYAQARGYLEQAIAAGKNTGVQQQQIAESYFGEAIRNSGGKSVNAENVALAMTGMPYLKSAVAADIAAGGSNAPRWAERGFTLARATKSPEIVDWAITLLKVEPSAENWRDALQSYQTANVGLSNDQSLDVMRLMRRANAMASSSDFAEYIEYADARRRPVEVLALLDEGKAKGLINASDVFIKEQNTIATGRVAEDRATLPSSEKAAMNAKDGAIALPTADALLGYSEPAKSIEFIELAIAKGNIDVDRAMMLKGIALADQGKYAEAKDAWSKVGGVRAPLAKLWALYVDQKTAPAAVAAAAPAA